MLLAVGQGSDEGSTEYRVIDFADVKAVREIFSGSDNLGVAAVAEYLPDFRTKLIFADGTSSEEYLPGEKVFYEKRGLYDEDGNLLKGYRRPSVSKISSLMPADLDRDGRMELLSLQSVKGLGSDDLLGKLAGCLDV